MGVFSFVILLVYEMVAMDVGFIQENDWKE